MKFGRDDRFVALSLVLTFVPGSPVLAFCHREAQVTLISPRWSKEDSYPTTLLGLTLERPRRLIVDGWQTNHFYTISRQCEEPLVGSLSTCINF
jgi:hypothetical protein